MRMEISIRTFIFLLTLAIGVCSLGCKDLKKYTMGPRCGGPDKVACPEGRRCDLDPGKCDDPNAYGVCVRLEDICDKKYKPICGCNGRTFGNDCNRVFSGVQKAHDGACEDTEQKAR